MIKVIALPIDILLEAKDFVGFVSILHDSNAKEHLKFVSSVTLRYSNASSNEQAIVFITNNDLIEEISSKNVEE